MANSELQPPSGPSRPPGFFQEDNGSYSAMRLMCFLALLAAVAFGALTLALAFRGKDTQDTGLYLTFGFLVAAFAPKAVQKFAEEKILPRPPGP